MHLSSGNKTIESINSKELDIFHFLMLSANASLAALCFAELSLYLSEEKLFVTNFSSMSTGKFFQLAAQFTLPRCISE